MVTASDVEKHHFSERSRSVHLRGRFCNGGVVLALLAIRTFRFHENLPAEAASSSALGDGVTRRRGPFYRLAREHLRFRRVDRTVAA
jgi:hypothetical protein